MVTFDYVLVGGGLQSALIALCVAHRQPAATIAIVERGARLGGNHTWCFHQTDLSASMRELVPPLVAWSWSEHEVQFPARHRVLPGAYHCVTSERLHEALSRLLHKRSGGGGGVGGGGNGSNRGGLYLGRAARRVEANEVELDDGSVLAARCVIDARGPDRLAARRVAGYQKFLGLEVEVEGRAVFTRPVLMDARVAQRDGFRFMYVLPFGPQRLLLEDTYFSDTPELDAAVLRQRVLDYALGHGLRIQRVLREETGVLPLPAELAPPDVQAPLRAGYQGGWFHPTTGYSFPVAARLAEFVASRAPEALHGGSLASLAREQRRQARFALMLNRMLFEAFPPDARFNVFERFYGLPEATIQRFYSLETTSFDRARILCGRPPRGLSLRRAVRRGVHS